MLNHADITSFIATPLFTMFSNQLVAATRAAAMRVGVIESRLGRKAEGVAAFRRAQESYATLAADFPAVPHYRRGLAGSRRPGHGQQKDGCGPRLRLAISLSDKASIVSYILLR